MTKKINRRRKASRPLGPRTLRRLPKILLHEHLDCSPRFSTMLELWEEFGFDFARVRFPQAVVDFWKATGFDVSSVAFPRSIVDLWMGKRVDASLKGSGRAVALRQHKQEAERLYSEFLRSYASASLANYVNAVVVHILPIMQSSENLRRIAEERIEDAVADGIVAMELRFGPQLHTWFGLTTDDVMKAIVPVVKESPIPVKLVLCAMRQEPGSVAWSVAKLCGKYRQSVGVFDLASDEKAFPGVLRDWIKAAILASLLGSRLTIHLWETNEPTAEDIELLDLIDDVYRLVNSQLRHLDAELRQVTRVDGTSLSEQQLEDLIDKAIDQASDERRQASGGSTGWKRPSRTGCFPRARVPAQHHLADRLGHGFRGGMQGDRFLEVCPTSNVITGQFADLSEHPIDSLLLQGKLVTVNTDGLTLTGLSGLSDEYERLVKTFGWGKREFLECNLNAVEASSFSHRQKARLRAFLKREYGK